MTVLNQTCAIIAQLLECGLSIIPTRSDKRPALKSWKPYQTQAIEVADIDKYFTNNKTCENIALVTGYNDVYAVDIDCKHDLLNTLYSDYCDLIPADLLDKLVIQKTKNKGYHFIFKCLEHSISNKKLASRQAIESEQDDTVKVLIETRGTGGYILIQPSSGYEIVQGDLLNIPTITKKEFITLLDSAKLLDKMPKKSKSKASTPSKPKPKKANLTYSDSSDISPADYYNQKENIENLLIAYGWTITKETNQKIYFKRGGDTSAKDSANWHKGHKKLIVHSTSTIFDSNKSYSLFDAYALIHHNDNKHEAMKAIKAQFMTNDITPPTQAQTGGPTPDPLREPNKIKPLKPKTKSISELLAGAKIDLFTAPPQPPIILKAQGNRLATLGNFSCVIGQAKSKKTFFITAVCSAYLDSSLYNNFLTSEAPTDKQNILYFDTEQGNYDAYKCVNRIKQLTGKPEKITAYKLRSFKPSERLSLIEYAIDNTDNVGLVIIDGVRDVVTSINDEEQATNISTKLLKITEERQIHIMCVLHENKSNGQIRGHIGTEIMNKCETLIRVTKDQHNPEQSIIKGELTRGKGFEDFALYINANGYPILSDYTTPPKKGQAQKFDIASITKNQHYEILQLALKDKLIDSYADLENEIKKAVSTLLIPIGSNKAITLIKHYKNHQLLNMSKIGRKVNYSLNNQRLIDYKNN